jgi:hypothetical protein
MVHCGRFALMRWVANLKWQWFWQTPPWPLLVAVTCQSGEGLSVHCADEE